MDAGGSEAALRRLLVAEITWTVPGDSPIAGTYRGLEEVFDCFRRRLELAGRTFQMQRRDALVGEGDRVAACRLLPLDQHAFDAIWSA